MRVAAQHLSRPGAVLCSRRTDAVLRGPPLPTKARKARKANSFRSSKGVVSSQGRVVVEGGGGGEKKEKAKKESASSSEKKKKKKKKKKKQC